MGPHKKYIEGVEDCIKILECTAKDYEEMGSRLSVFSKNTINQIDKRQLSQQSNENLDKAKILRGQIERFKELL